MPKSKPHIAIVGGGIGGLFAANALIAHGLQRLGLRAGARRSARSAPASTSRRTRCASCERVGLGPAVEKWGALVGPSSHYFRHDGTPIAPVQVADASGWNATFGMHRADFVDFLAANLPAGIVHTGHRAIGFEQDGDIARVNFANGATVEADVVVAADGIHSELRPYVFPPSKPVFHGTISYRGLVAARAPAGLADGPLADVGRPVQALPGLPGAPRHHGQLRRLRADRRGDEGVVVGARQSRRAARASSKAGTRASAQVLAAGRHDCFRWALYDREPLPTWTKGRLTLLGDAAHPMLPHLGQGANQSIEDGMALATILAQVDTCGSAGGAAGLRAAAPRARRRGSARRAAERPARRFRRTPISAVRDAELAAHAEFRKHLYAYDVVPEAKKVMAGVGWAASP